MLDATELPSERSERHLRKERPPCPTQTCPHSGVSLSVLCEWEVGSGGGCVVSIVLGRLRDATCSRAPREAPLPPPGPEDSCEAYRHVLGQNKVSYEVHRFHGDEERFFVEGLSFPDAGFSGLVAFHVTLLDDSNEVGAARTDRVGNGLPAQERWVPPAWRILATHGCLSRN